MYVCSTRAGAFPEEHHHHRDRERAAMKSLLERGGAVGTAPIHALVLGHAKGCLWLCSPPSPGRWWFSQEKEGDLHVYEPVAEEPRHAYTIRSLKLVFPKVWSQRC